MFVLLYSLCSHVCLEFWKFAFVFMFVLLYIVRPHVSLGISGKEPVCLCLCYCRQYVFKVYRGDFQGTPTLVHAPRAQAKKIENKNLGFFPRYLPNYCAAQCLVGFMTSFFCSLIGSSAT